MKKDFYDILGVSKNASESEIKSAYKKMAMKYHPDRHQGEKKAEAEVKFKEVNEAYTVLSNPEKKQAYDQFGDANAAGHNPFGQGFSQEGFPDINDILNSFFGGGAQQNHSQRFRGDDLGYTLKLSLEEAARGVEKELSIRKKAKCDSCEGTGSQSRSKPATCQTCHGRGKITLQQGFMAVSQVCHTCHGEGVIIKDPCKKCRGKGCYTQSSQVKVRIPSGVDTGDRMRVPNKGDAGIRGGANGDLYITIDVSTHPIFEREGENLHCQVPISYCQACLGASVDVATLDGMIKLKVPKETQSGSLLRVRGKGIQSAKANRQGDLICHIVVETPVKLSKKQAELLQAFEDSLDKNAKQYPKHASFLQRIKKLFN